MNIASALKELSKTLGPPKPRAAFGSWVPSAWLVRGLVEKGHEVTAAVRHVLEHTGQANNKQAFGSLRAAFYKIKDREWPTELANKDDTTFE